MPDREAVINTLEEIKTQTAEIGLDMAVIAHEFIDKIIALLKEQDAEPLRCKECSYHRNDGWCNEHKREVKESDYCSFGAWESR